MATAKAVVRKDKPLKDGTWPVAIRIIAQSKPKYINIGVSVSPGQWHDKNRQLTAKHPRYREFNAKLNRMISDIQARIDDYMVQRVEPTVDDLVREKIKRTSMDFFVIAEGKRVQFLAKGQQGTYLKWQFVVGKFKDYCNGLLPMDDLTPELLQDYKDYLVKEKKNNPSTVHANFKILRAVYFEATKRGFTSGVNPFLSIEVKPSTTYRERLTLDEIKAIEGLNLEPGTSIYLAQQTFLFSFYCWGMRFRDVCLLTAKDFHGKSLTYLTSKSGGKKRITLEMNKKAYLIYKKFLGVMQPDQPYLFPLLKKTYVDLLEYERAVAVANETVNKALKQVALKAKIDKVVSFHVARHSFVDVMKHSGVPTEKRMQMVGHSSEATHKRYHGDFDSTEMSDTVNKILG